MESKSPTKKYMKVTRDTQNIHNAHSVTYGRAHHKSVCLQCVSFTNLEPTDNNGANTPAAVCSSDVPDLQYSN